MILHRRRRRILTRKEWVYELTSNNNFEVEWYSNLREMIFHR